MNGGAIVSSIARCIRISATLATTKCTHRNSDTNSSSNRNILLVLSADLSADGVGWMLLLYTLCYCEVSPTNDERELRQKKMCEKMALRRWKCFMYRRIIKCNGSSTRITGSSRWICSLGCVVIIHHSHSDHVSMDGFFFEL